MGASSGLIADKGGGRERGTLDDGDVFVMVGDDG